MRSWKIISLVALGTLSACAVPPGGSSGKGAATAKPKVVHSAYLTGKPRPGSKFAKVQPGMSRQEVENLIGLPTSRDGHITGKQYIPFYFGGDTYRTDWYYKGEGELTFSNNSYVSSNESLIYIRVDAKASGYRK